MTNQFYYPSEISLKCAELLKTTGLQNLTPKAKPFHSEILEATSHFPSSSLMSWRIRAIAENNPTICPQCNVVHGDPRHIFCSQKCYTKNKSINAISEEDKRKDLLKSFFDKAEEKFKDKQEGYDYLVCEICGQKSEDLGTHIVTHSLKPKEYKLQFNLKSLKCQKLIDRVKGENNPGFNHQGKFSKWSKNFINGYDEAAHNEFKQKQKELMLSDEYKKNSIFCREFYNSEEEYLAHQTKNLDFFINKYGEEEGTKRYSAKTEKWLNTLSEKSEEEMNEINRKKMSGSNKSKAEIELFTILQKEFSSLKDQFVLNDNGKRYIFDMEFNKKIIEYYGDYWHSNPTVYSEDYFNFKSGKTAKQIWEENERKVEFAKSIGYDVLIIWEKDWNKNKQVEINKCLSFLSTSKQVPQITELLF